MTHQTLDDIMHIVFDNLDFENFVPTPHFKTWHEKCKGYCHTHGHKLH